MVAPPPGMLVITIDVPVISSKNRATVRALKSVSPPGLAPMMTLTVRLGQSVWAKALVVISASAVADKAAVNLVFMVGNSSHCQFRRRDSAISFVLIYLSSPAKPFIRPLDRWLGGRPCRALWREARNDDQERADQDCTGEPAPPLVC